MVMDQRKKVLRRFARSTTVVLKSCGFPIDEVRDAFTEAYDEIEVPVEKPGERSDTDQSIVDMVGTMLSRWRAEAAYNDSSGEPRAIPRFGEAPSVEALYRSVAAARSEGLSCSEEEAAAAMLEYKAAEQDEEGLWKVVGTTFRLTSSGASTALMNLVYIVQLATTVAHNAFGDQGGRWQYVSKATRFPRKSVGLVTAFLNEHGFSFLEDVDEVIEKEVADRASEPGPKIDCGVGMYLFEDDPDSEVPFLK